MARKAIKLPDNALLWPCYCPIHGDVMVCPTCEGAKGGHKTAQRHKGKHAEWGKKGGRPKKKQK